MPRVAVLGAGVAGLGAAHRLMELARGDPALSITVFEAQARAGGCVQTINAGGSVLELGADSLHYGKPAIVSLLQRLQLDGAVVEQQAAFRGAMILHRGKLRRLPPEFRLFAPRSVPAILRSGLFTPAGAARAALEPLVRKGANGDESLASFVTRRLGHEVLDRLAQPLIGGIYSADPRRLSMEMALPEFLRYEREYGSLLRAMHRAARAVPPRLVSLRGGLQTLIDALFARVGRTVQLDNAVSAVTRSGGSWRVKAGGHEQTFDAVICALPVFAAASAFAELSSLSQVLGSIRTTRIAVVNLAYAADAVRLPPSTGFVVPAVEGRSITAATFASQKYPDRSTRETVLVRAFVGGSLQESLLSAPDSEIANLASREIGQILGVTDAPQDAIVTRWQNLPQYDVGHRGKLALLRDATSGLPGLYFAGCGYEGVGVPDCVAAGEAAAESVFGYLIHPKGAQRR